MSVTGLFLIIFLLLHATINGLSLISADAFRAGCDFMALPIITVMVPILAAGFIIHIIYAIYLSWTNYKARGNNRYAVANKSQADNWAAKNMLILGIVVLGLLAFHLTHFWADMQLLQFQGVPHDQLADPYGLLLVRGSVDAPDPRFLERIPHSRLEQQYMDRPPEGHLLHRGYHHLPGVRGSGSSILPEGQRNNVTVHHNGQTAALSSAHGSVIYAQ